MAKLVLLAALVAAAVAAACSSRVDASEHAPVINALRPRRGSGRQLAERAGVACDSWRLAVEAHNKRDWRTVPAECESYVGHYMLGEQYRRDSRAVVDEAVAYAESLRLAGKGREVWVFDVDETSLSNLPYYATHGFGAQPYNATSFNAYVLQGSAPALPETLRLYRRLVSLGIRPVFLTGRTDDQRAITTKNLNQQGYFGWDRMLLKPVGAKVAAIAYKSGARQKLRDAGYVIVGNIGDQWSDILGAPEGARTFKLPDPMYYIG